MPIRPRRSVLYMPGSNARALEKARSLDADCLILDLEDSVAPDAKEAARRQVGEAVAAGGFGGREVVIRMNALSSAWGDADLAAIAAASPDAVLVPKVDDAEEIFEVGRRLDRLGAPRSLAIWSMMETPRAVLEPLAVASAREEDAGRRLAALVLGTNDLARETRTRLAPGRAMMLGWLANCVAAGRACDLDVIDGVYGNLADADGLEAECIQGRDLGMDGKTLIHPGQIAVANSVFAPSQAEVAEARRVIDAFALPENQSRGVIALDGRMVERLHAEMAARVVALDEAIRARG